MAQRILFITSTRIGDAVLSSGLLAHLVAQYPSARFTVACGAPAAPLFAAAPRIDRVLVIEKRPWKLHWIGLWLACARHRWDMVVDLRRSGFAWLVSAGQRHVKRESLPDRHRVEEDARVLSLDPPPSPRIWIADRDDARARELVPAGRPVLAIGPTANWGAKEWPAANFGALVETLTAPDGVLPGALVMVMGALSERPRALPLIDTLPSDRLIDLFGESLPVAFGCLCRASLFVGNDSGLMHLAAASGAPTLGLFGPSPERRYAPWGPNAAFVRTSQSYDELVNGPGFDHRDERTLMEGLSVDAAAEAARALLARIAKTDGHDSA